MSTEVLTHRHTIEAAVVTVCLCLLFLLTHVTWSGNFGTVNPKEGVALVSSDLQSALAFFAGSDLKRPEWLWFYKLETVYRKAEAGFESKTQGGSNVTNKNTGAVYPPQVETSKNQLLVSAEGSEVGREEEYVAGAFSDEVLVEFFDSRHGTVTAEFSSGISHSYPFKLLSKQIETFTE
jgi:hypothetical protein